MKYVFDIDGTICSVTDGDYENAVPNRERIEHINHLHQLGHRIVLYTARGMGRSKDSRRAAEDQFYELTERQLLEWGVSYDRLSLGKPAGDIYVDDKASTPEDFFPIKRVQKGWGYEDWIANSPLYCGKLLHFEAGKRCSYHYHKLKDETFYVHSGLLVIRYGESDDIDDSEMKLLGAGARMHIPRGLRHQIIAVEDTDMFEFSTEHFDEDSYRVVKGD